MFNYKKYTKSILFYLSGIIFLYITLLHSRDFQTISILSSIDNEVQKIKVLKTNKNKKLPLIISLHTWHGDYTQKDGLEEIIRNNKNYHYVHPDFRGPNTNKNACLSPFSISDVDDAISYMLENYNVDRDNIFVVGHSGGGLATLGIFFHTKHKINTFIASCPITDLVKWYTENFNSSFGKNYRQDLITISGSNEKINFIELKKRSPLFMLNPSQRNGKIEIFAGIYDQRVNFMHAVNFYNMLAKKSNLEEIIEKEILEFFEKNEDHIASYDEIIFYKKENPKFNIYLSNTGHDYLVKNVYHSILKNTIVGN